MEKNKKIANIILTVLTSIKTILLIGLLIYYMIKVLDASQYDDEGNIIALNNSQKGLIYFAFISIIVTFILLAISFLIYFIYDYENKNKLILFSFLTFSIEGLIFSLYLITKTGYQKLKIDFKFFKKWKIIDITLIALLLCLYLLISFITGFIPQMPFWITISIKYIILYFGAYILSLSASFTLCLLAACLTTIMPGTAIHTFVQYLFDYFIPIVGFFVAGFFVPKNEIKNKYYQIFSWLIFVISPIFVLYGSRVLSGVLYWLNPAALGDDVYYSFLWEGRWGYSAIYNSFNTITDYVTLQILVPVICKTLTYIKNKVELKKLNSYN
ncbi:thiamine transporter [Spiroplasma gladiatoris]|uniref:Thiamine transporter n=1 Tax=Spiroplasma gladiatoris TaxID=2143 RepID=A0A4V1AQ71_9MOLU|nr:energy-coupled thiamine transporter ThiT [Spiroplasma gladiatoris]QBQ07479.1 thiamine transporter [Spiroplasma gladiatoris]